MKFHTRTALDAALVLLFGIIVAFASLHLSSDQLAGNSGIDKATNDYRVSQGTYPLNTWMTLQPVADLRVQQISTSDTFGHPENWQVLFNMLPSCVTLIGENIANRSPYVTDSTQFVVMWIASEGHRLNMLGAWTWQASAVYNAPDGRTYAVQLFTKGCGTVSTPIPIPVATPKPPAYVPPPVIVVPPKVIVVPVPIPRVFPSDVMEWLPCLWHESFIKYKPNMNCN